MRIDVRWASARQRLPQDENGASAVEFAIVGSLLIALILGTIQLGWTLQIHNQMSKAVDASVRFATLDRASSAGEIEQKFSTKINGALKDLDSNRLVIAPLEQGQVEGVNVWKFKVTYNMPVIVPGLPANIASISTARWAPRWGS